MDGAKPSNVQEESGSWADVSSLYNWCNKDPLLDWLARFGSSSGLPKDTENENYLEEADYELFLRTVANEFEARVLELVSARIHVQSLKEAGGNSDELYRATLDLMQRESEAIYQGLVRDQELRVFGKPDFIVRGSALDRLVPGALQELNPDAYYVLDAKFKGLSLNKQGDLAASHSWERIQLGLYDRALAAMSGRDGAKSFVIGRQLSGDSGGGCLDQLGWVKPLDEKGLALIREGLSWLKELREHGATWTIGSTHDPRLTPNVSNKRDAPWHSAKKELIGSNARASWVGEPVQPNRITAGRTDWGAPDGVEFFVDFETLNGMNDDFSRFPSAGGTPMIFMIGCGHEEDGEFVFRVWTAESESHEAEAQIIREWMAHMDAITSRLGSGGRKPLVYHWFAHEVRELSKAGDRHSEPAWSDVGWYDLLKEVFQAEPVRIQETDGSGLKAVARKLKELGRIETIWGEGPVSDGLAAMTAAWSCYAASRATGRPVHSAIMVGGKSLMAEIEAYNEVDCKTMWEILRYLRANH